MDVRAPPPPRDLASPSRKPPPPRPIQSAWSSTRRVARSEKEEGGLGRGLPWSARRRRSSAPVATPIHATELRCRSPPPACWPGRRRPFTAVIEKDPATGLFVGYVPGWPGAHSQGATVEGLREHRREVVDMILEDGEPAQDVEVVGTATVRLAWVPPVPPVRPREVESRRISACTWSSTWRRGEPHRAPPARQRRCGLGRARLTPGSSARVPWVPGVTSVAACPRRRAGERRAGPHGRAPAGQNRHRQERA